MRDLLLLVPSDTCGTNQIKAQPSVETLVKVRYHYTLTCEDEQSRFVKLVIFIHFYFKHTSPVVLFRVKG